MAVTDERKIKVAEMNADLMDKLQGPEEMRKSAENTVTSYTRLKMRELSISRQILPPIPVNPSDMVRRLEDDKPVIYVDLEIDNAMATSVPLGTFPSENYIRGHRYAVPFQRITTDRYTKDVAELDTYTYDLRQMITDNSIKDMMAEEDGKFMGLSNRIVGPVGVVNPATGIAQHVQVSGGLSRATLSRALKVLPSSVLRLPVAKCLINNLTITDVQEWGRDEVGGDLAQNILQEGLTTTKFFGKEFYVTIKRELVPDNCIFFYSSPDKLGKFFVREDTTLSVKRDDYMFSFRAYEYIGASIGNIGGVARVDFVP